MRMLTIVMGGFTGIALVVAGLWGWQEARDMVLDWGAGRPEVAAWAVRSAAVAAIAFAQVVLVTAVAGRVFRRRGMIDDIMRLTAGLVCALAVVTAIACGLAGK